MDLGWLVAAILFAAAARLPAPERRASRSDGHRVLVVPITFGLAGLALLVVGNLDSINRPALALATVCVLSVIARVALTYAQSHRESLTDPLTGLANRRGLARDLRERAAGARADRPIGLVIFDLNGFKSYNDRFGHPAGDALLARLARRLREALCDGGAAYRMGGDEFCALLPSGPISIEAQVARALAALSERGKGFEIDAAHGLVLVPADASTCDEALGLADQRMYQRKHSRRIPPERQTTDALVQMLCERDPKLGDHADGVAELAAATGQRLGVSDDDLTQLTLAARLHDIGKCAIPDDILTAPRALRADEWEIVRRHPAVGARILRAAPALARVADMVRASHERLDGTGYPDGLAGDRIPLGARVIAVCDAFDAIIANRPYAVGRTPADAAAELERCAGTQFDPAVVAAFLEVLAERRRQPAGGPLEGAPVRAWASATPAGPS